MPQCVRRFSSVWFLILISFLGALAQLPTSADVMRDRIKKTKVLIAVKNYNAAIYELEGIRKETGDPAVNSVAQVMLMNCYLEQSDYKRAQALLVELYNAKKQNRFGGDNYYAVAGQVVRGAKIQAERYKSLGLSVADANLPPDAVNDVNKMRETVETVITQSKILGANAKETPSAMALLEEATAARSNLARDNYDAKRWKDEVADARDNLVNSKGVIDAVGDGAQTNTLSAANTNPTSSAAAQNPVTTMPVAGKPSAEIRADNKPAAPQNTATTATANVPSVKTETPKPEISKPETPKPNDTMQSKQTAQNQNAAAPNVKPAPTRMRKVENTPAQTPNVSAKTPNVSADKVTTSTADNAAKNDSPLSVGSLLEYATAKVNPTYPPAAKTMRTVGTVRVDLIVDEDGKPEIQNASGPGMLKQAAQDAVKRWKFKPFTRDGQPVKASGYVSFNFNL